MILRIYQTNAEMYVKPEMVDAVIPEFASDGETVLYNTVIIAGEKYKVEGNTSLIIRSKMKKDW